MIPMGLLRAYLDELLKSADPAETPCMSQTCLCKLTYTPLHIGCLAADLLYIYIGHEGDQMHVMC